MQPDVFDFIAAIELLASDVGDRPFIMIVQENTTGWDLFQTVVRSIG